MTYNRAPERPQELFHTDVATHTVYIDDCVGLSKLGPICKVAQNRGIGEHYTIIRVPAAQLRRLVNARRRTYDSGQSKSVSRSRVGRSVKPSPPGYTPTSQLTHREKRKRYGLGFAPLRDWWPKTS